LKSQFSRADNAAAETRAARKKTGKKCTKKQELDSEHTPGNQVDIFIWGAQDLLLLLLFLLYPRKGRTICDADDGVTGQRKRTAAVAAGSRVWGEGSGDERSITAAEYAPPSPRGYEVEGGLRLWEDRTRTRTLTWSSGLSVTQDSGSTRRENKHSIAKYHKFSI